MKIVFTALIFTIFSFPVVSYSEDAYTPERGSEERTSIITAVKGMGGEAAGNDIVLVVGHFKVSDGWAFIRCEPWSADRKNRLEQIDALLQKQGGRWIIAEARPCCGECADDPDCATDYRYFRALKKRFPSAPADIFPKEKP